MAHRPISNEKLREVIESTVEQACDEWEALRARGVDEPIRLYFRKPNDRQRVGRLKVATSDPKRGWELAVHMRMSPKWTRDETKFFVYERLVKLPLLRGPFCAITPPMDPDGRQGSPVPVGLAIA